MLWQTALMVDSRAGVTDEMNGTGSWWLNCEEQNETGNTYVFCIAAYAAPFLLILLFLLVLFWNDVI